MPQAAVIIPVYNRTTVLVRAIVSVLNQTFTDFECIIVDDCSDNPVTDTFNDQRIHIVHLDRHCGVSCARNTGVAAASAPVITFLDSDDEWLPRKLESQINYLQCHPYPILQSREIWIRQGVRVNPPATHQKKTGFLFAESLQRCMITPSSVLLKRTLFEEFGGFNESLPACEDYDLWLRITAQYQTGLVDEQLLIRYGGHNDQLSASVPILDRFRVRSMLQLLLHAPLNFHQQLLIKKQITKKATILANGFRKRGNHDAYKQYQSIAATFGA